MRTFSIIIVDDEQAAHFALQKMLNDYDNLNLIGQAYSGKEASEKIIFY